MILGTTRWRRVSAALLLSFLAVTGCAKKIQHPSIYYADDRATEVPSTQNAGPAKQIKQPTVRIGIDTKVNTAVVTGSQLFYVLDVNLQEKLGKLEAYQKVKFKAAAEGIEVYGPKGNLAFTRLSRVLIGSDKPETWISINGARYRGAVELFSNSSETMTFVNVIPVEDYLRGVVPKEIGKITLENVESAKAQAVAARTYTYANLGRRGELGFDLYATVQDQVYGGMDAENPLIDQAIAATAGIVATYNGALIEAYYHSTSGPMTAGIDDVWEGKPMPYLRAIANTPNQNPHSDDFFCKESPHFSWTETWTRSQLEASLRKNLPTYTKLRNGDLGTLKDIKIIQKDRSNRVKQIRFTTTTGAYDVFKDKIRWVMRRPGADQILRSTLFDVNIERNGDDVVRISTSGGGNGHGIGMCQWGAMGMAKRGYNYTQILTHYYTGIELRQMRTN